MSIKGISLIIDKADFSDLAIDVVTTTSSDITSQFTWTDSTVIKYASGAEGTSSYMKASDYVDITGGVSISLSFMTWTSSSGGKTTYGLAFYDVDKAYIDGYGFPLGNSGNSNGESYTLTLDIPEGAQYIRTTYQMDITTYGEFSANLIAISS